MSSFFSEPTRAWWKSSVVFQVYPASFADSNDDGVGDLNGMNSRFHRGFGDSSTLDFPATKLDYLRTLGIDIVWLSPIYKSPQADMGYDISDYEDIDPRYGTLEDWDKLLKGVHDRGMKLMMDLVVNHTSDEHAWFQESRSSKTNPKRDWYIWRPARYDENGKRSPPSNWKAQFEGSAWEWDEVTQEYYLHLYLPKQPDLNWENELVREAVWGVMRFWIARGCDGFRMDVINIISKTPGFPDAPIVNADDEFQPAEMYFANGPRVHEYLKEMHAKVLAHHDLITVGEAPFTHDEKVLAEYSRPENKELQMVFTFDHMNIDQGTTQLEYKAWSVPQLARLIARWQESQPWNSVYIQNHDHARAVSRFGNDSPAWRAISAKLLSILQITQSGTLYIYQGEEIGMKNFPASWPLEEYKDVATQNYWNETLAKRRLASGKQDVDMSDVLEGCHRKARDHGRTPMQWNESENAGFSGTGIPWMRVNDDYPEGWNATAQIKDKNSVWSFWKLALAARKANEVLIYGDFKVFNPSHEKVFGYTRTLGSVTALILLNFKEEKLSYELPADKNFDGYKFLLGNYAKEGDVVMGGKLELKEYEGIVYIHEG